jgi:UBX domain-containing protein 6
VLPQTESSESESETGGGGGTGESEQLAVFRELLCSSEPLKPTLDRNVTLFTPSPHVNHFDLSNDFFQLSIDEIRKEQKLKTEAIERDQVLRTKAMRERDETRTAARYYRYTLLRVRLPDGLFLQAVFRPLDKLSDVRQVISHAFRDGTLTFSLSAFGQLLKNDSDTLAALGLVPSAVLNLSWVGAGPDSRQQYLDSELLQRIQQL